MSPQRSTFLWPGPGRMTLVLLAAVPALMAYPWSSVRHRWVLGVAVAVLMVLLGWWRHLRFTTILQRRVAMLRSRRAIHAGRRSGPDARTTVLLRVIPSDTGAGMLPLRLITGYLNRYGLRAESVRITSRDARAETGGARRDTWIGLTFSATANLAALQARSPQIPLRQTAEVAVRRLADHLREIGWETAPAGPDDVPDLFGPTTRETWRAVIDGATDYVAAYQISVDHELADTFATVWAYGAPETWTAVELAGSQGHLTVAAGCALRTAEPPAAASPLAGLTPQHGNHRPALLTLHPLSGRQLAGHTEAADAAIAALRWPTAPGRAGTSAVGSHGRHRGR